jgi:tetratricopeptide (TPR) repeat protein
VGSPRPRKSWPSSRRSARAWRAIGQHRFFSGQAASAEDALNRALEHARAASAQREIVEAIQWRGAVRLFGPIDVEEGIRRFEEELARSFPGRREFDALRGLAVLRAMRGDFEEARASALEIVSGTDWLDYRATLLMDMAEVLRLAGRGEEAAPFVREAVDVAETRGNIVRERQARELLAELAPEELAQRD